MNNGGSKAKSTEAVASLSIPDASDSPLNFSKGELGQIQEILLGSHLRAYNDRLTQLGLQMEAKITEVTRSFDSQLILLNEKVENSLAELEKKLEGKIAEKDRLQISNQARISGEIAGVKSHFSDRLNEASGEASKLQEHLIKDFDSHKSEVEKVLDQSRSDLLSHLELAVTELNTQKLDRNALSGLLDNIAKQLAVESPD